MEEFIFIRAYDNGIPQLYSILTVRIIVSIKKLESSPVYKELTYRFA